MVALLIFKTLDLMENSIRVIYLYGLIGVTGVLEDASDTVTRVDVRDLKSVRQLYGGGLVRPRSSITGGRPSETSSAKRDAGYD